MTVTPKVNEPIAVGVPEITPVLGARVKPPGKLPVASWKVYGPVPPMTTRFAEYPCPIVPPGTMVLKTGGPPIVCENTP